MPDSDIDEQVRAHEARNEVLLAHLRELGVTLDSPREVDCHFWAPTRELAESLVQELLGRGFAGASASPHDRDGMQSVEGKVRETPLVVTSRAFVAELVQLAAARGCVFDGWGTRVSEAAPDGWRRFSRRGGELLGKLLERLTR